MLIHCINKTVESIKDSIIMDTPITIGKYVQLVINSCDVVHPVAPLGLDTLMAMSRPLKKPINVTKQPLRNKIAIIITALICF